MGAAGMRGLGLSAQIIPSLLARDLEETTAFYCDRLGFERVGRYPESGPATWAALRRGDGELHFFSEAPTGLPDTPCFSGTLYFHPGNVRALADELREKVTFAWGPEEMDYGMLEFAVQDPNGYFIAFWEPAERQQVSQKRGGA